MHPKLKTLLTPVGLAVSIGVAGLTDAAESPTLVGSIPAVNIGTGFAMMRDVVVQGKYAYIAGEGKGLLVVDISNPASPVAVRTNRTSGIAAALAISGNHVYVGIEGGLRIFNITDPAAPVAKGSYNNAGNYVWDAVLAGNHAFLAHGAAGLQILDITNPSAPRRVGGYPSGDANGVALSGKYAYVASVMAGLQIVDVSNPAKPVLTGTIDTDGFAVDVVVSGNYAYVADFDAGLQIIDVSDPAAPKRVGGYKTGSNEKVILAGNYAFLATRDGGMRIVDVSVPSAPKLAGSYKNELSEWTMAVAVVGDLAYLVGNSLALEIVRLPTSTIPPAIAITLGGRQAVLSWPAAAEGFSLESSSLLGAGATWTPRRVGVVNENGRYVLTNQESAGTLFFRLQHP